MSKTTEQYKKVIASCRAIFEKKAKDYGTSWRIARASSLTDQIFIKANRIRTIQETGQNKVGESIEGEFGAIINYCALAIIQVRNLEPQTMELSPEKAMEFSGFKE